jgi:hypothetical protein
MHKGYKYLDVSTGCVYISRDVIFDENIFSFSELHPNASAHFTSEVLHLPDNHPSWDNAYLPVNYHPIESCLPCSTLVSP